MNKEIFSKARIVSKYICNVEETPKSVFAEFQGTDIKTSVRKEGKELKGECVCTHFTYYQSDCSHILALKYYLIKNSETNDIDLRIV